MQQSAKIAAMLKRRKKRKVAHEETQLDELWGSKKKPAGGTTDQYAAMHDVLTNHGYTTSKPERKALGGSTRGLYKHKDGVHRAQLHPGHLSKDSEHKTQLGGPQAISHGKRFAVASDLDRHLRSLHEGWVPPKKKTPGPRGVPLRNKNDKFVKHDPDGKKYRYDRNGAHRDEHGDYKTNTTEDGEEIHEQALDELSYETLGKYIKGSESTRDGNKNRKVGLHRAAERRFVHATKDNPPASKREAVSNFRNHMAIHTAGLKAQREETEIDEGAVARTLNHATRAAVTVALRDHPIAQAAGIMAGHAVERASNKTSEYLGNKLKNIGSKVKSGRRLINKFTKEETGTMRLSDLKKLNERAVEVSKTVYDSEDDEGSLPKEKNVKAKKPTQGPVDLKKEEVIAELSRKTLKSYIKKADGTGPRSSWGLSQRGEKEEDKSMSTDGNKFPEKQERHQKAASKLYNKSTNREKGAALAHKKIMTKEDVDLISEISKKLAKRYINKATDDINLKFLSPRKSKNRNDGIDRAAKIKNKKD